MIFFQMMKISKGRKNKLKGHMRPAGLSLAMSALCYLPGWPKAL